MIGTDKRYDTILIQRNKGMLILKLHRPNSDNNLNAILIKEIMDVLQEVEKDPEIIMVIIEGGEKHFCTGMDFKEVSEGGKEALIGDDPNNYYEMLSFFSSCSKVIVSKVRGKVNAGGIGIVAASDIVIAEEKSTFGLSEALFGLLPACVMPFLIRRIGYQRSLWMTLMTQGITADRAAQIGLVDELTSDVNDAVRKASLRLMRLEPSTIKHLKNYMSKLWVMDAETQSLAVNTITSLLNSNKVQMNIENFVKKGKFPWDK